MTQPRMPGKVPSVVKRRCPDCGEQRARLAAGPGAPSGHYVRSLSTTDGHGASAFYAEDEGGVSVSPFDGRRDVIDPWAPAFMGMQTLCRCPAGRQPLRETAPAIRAAVADAVDRRRREYR